VTVRYLQLLRELGVMVYSEELSTRAEKSGEICVGSDEEVEISAATAVCVESLVEEEVTGLGQKITAMQKEIVIEKTRDTLR